MSLLKITDELHWIFETFVSISDATERLDKEDLHEPRASVIFSNVSAVYFVF